MREVDKLSVICWVNSLCLYSPRLSQAHNLQNKVFYNGSGRLPQPQYGVGHSVLPQFENTIPWSLHVGERRGSDNHHHEAIGSQCGERQGLHWWHEWQYGGFLFHREGVQWNQSATFLAMCARHLDGGKQLFLLQSRMLPTNCCGTCQGVTAGQRTRCIWFWWTSISAAGDHTIRSVRWTISSEATDSKCTSSCRALSSAWVALKSAQWSCCSTSTMFCSWPTDGVGPVAAYGPTPCRCVWHRIWRQNLENNSIITAVTQGIHNGGNDEVKMFPKHIKNETVDYYLEMNTTISKSNFIPSHSFGQTMPSGSWQGTMRHKRVMTMMMMARRTTMRLLRCLPWRSANPVRPRRLTRSASEMNDKIYKIWLKRDGKSLDRFAKWGRGFKILRADNENLPRSNTDHNVVQFEAGKQFTVY